MARAGRLPLDLPGFIAKILPELGAKIMRPLPVDAPAKSLPHFEGEAGAQQRACGAASGRDPSEARPRSQQPAEHGEPNARQGEPTGSNGTPMGSSQSNQSEPTEQDLAAVRQGVSGLLSGSFLGLLVTQFLGALNDNIFRWLAVFVGMDLVANWFSRQTALAYPGAVGAWQEATKTAGLGLLVLPFILLAAPAGYVADRFSKQRVIVFCKAAEVVVMGLGVMAILSGNVFVLLAVVFLMGSQSAMFSPAKYGAIPEIVRPERLQAANGLVAMTTIVAVVTGAVMAGYLHAWTAPLGRHYWWISAAVLLGVAGAGLLTSLLIRRLPVANPHRLFPVRAATRTVHDFKVLLRLRPLACAALGSAAFWGLGAVCHLSVERVGRIDLSLAPKDIGPMLGVLAVGVAMGNVLAGLWSRGRIELGMVPFGAAGIGVWCLVIGLLPSGPAAAWSGVYLWYCAGLLLLGMSAGMYDVPLLAFLQHRSPPRSRGAVLAAANIMTSMAIILGAVLSYALGGPLAFSGRTIFLLLALMMVPVVFIAARMMPRDTLSVFLKLLMGLMYRIRVQGQENIPARGPALLISNHVSYVDGFLLRFNCPRPVRFVAYADYFQSRLARWFAGLAEIIPITPGRRSVVESIRAAREALQRGQVVCIFAEGSLTRSGHVGPFQPGFLKVVKGTDVPVIPVHLGGLWGSIFSHAGARCFWKLPRRWPYSVSVRFGRPIRRPSGPDEVRRAVLELGETAVPDPAHQQLVPVRRFVRMCRRNLRRVKVADSTGAQLSGAQLLTRSLVLRRLLRRKVLGADEQYVGVLLPSSAAGVVANAALALDRRVVVNLNYTQTSEVVNACLRECGIRRVLTSRRVMEKLSERFPLELDAQLVYLEDLRQEVSLVDKLAAAAGTWLLPAAVLERMLGLSRIQPDELLTVIFTAGSTGRPKGAMLTHRNIGSNIEAFNQIIRLTADDVLTGVLPLFHSFGYTTTLWTVLTLDPKGIYHSNPLEAREVGRLCRRQGATILLATPTFLRAYLRRCEPEDFARLEVVVVGAEKLPQDLADAFEERFGAKPVEGYGATELSPVVSANIPPSRTQAASLGAGVKPGTVGPPLPGVEAKVVDVDTGQALGRNRSGMLLVRGPNVMKGYLNQSERTAEVLRDGWYVTGDVAEIDEDDYIRITGRLSRFSKLGGEMVPHLRVEEALIQVLGLDEEQVSLAVTAVPDPKKGERLVVLHTGLAQRPEEICRRLVEAGLPRLWVPSPESFFRIDALPVLGAGKLDLRQLGAIARQKAGASQKG